MPAESIDTEAECVHCGRPNPGRRPGDVCRECQRAALGLDTEAIRQMLQVLDADDDALGGGYAMVGRALVAERDELRAELAAERAKVQRVEAVCAEVETDDGNHLSLYGQHLQGAVVRVAELVRAALIGEESERPMPVIEHPRDAKGSTYELGVADD